MTVEAPDESSVNQDKDRPTLPGKVTQLERGNIGFVSEEKTEFRMPIISSVWKPELIAKAQAVAEKRGVSLEQIVQEWEAAWAVNG